MSFRGGAIGSTWGYDLLTTIGFHVDFYCDNKKEKGIVIRDNIKTISLEELYSLGSGVLVFITVTDRYHKSIQCQLQQKGIYNIVEVGYLFLQIFIESLFEMNVQKLNKQFQYILDDKEYISRQFEYHFGYRPDFCNPKTLTEKLQWIKLYDRKPEYESMVDKYKAKKYVSDKIGEKYIIPTLGIYNSFDEIDLKKLPQQFVLKCTHDSGSVMICKNRDSFDLEEAKEFLNKRLTRNFYWLGREWPYKNVRPRIIAEKYLSPTSGEQVCDYKIMCFEGEPYLIEVICNRFTNHLTEDFYDVNWNKTEIYQEKMPVSDILLDKPSNLNEMLNFSRKLAQGIHCIRVDWYNVDGQLFFGELTFFDGGGFEAFCPKNADRRMGDLIKLPLKQEVFKKNNTVFEEIESEVRSYCRKYPVKFQRAKNAEVFAVDGKRYIDFLSVAGSMNFGHNNPEIKAAIVEYLQDDNIINALDMYTEAKEDFFIALKNKILKPRNLQYKVMCCGPTGTNAIEAALKLARKNMQRKNVIAFAGAFHGMTLGSLAMTTDRDSRTGGGVSLPDVTFVPYDGIMDSIAYLKWILEDDHSGVEKPAAIFMETLQAEGGINIASIEWLQKIREICDEYNILMICDDIQVGVGRTGYFFSFERAGIVPDMVVLSKSISGFGMPMALLLMRPELDIFKPAEHNGTFRGNQLSFIGGTAGIDYFCKYKLDLEVQRKSVIVEEYIKDEICVINDDIRYRGMGLIWGIDFGTVNPQLAEKIVHIGFKNGMIMEVAGRKNSVLKLMPPLTVEDEILIEGLKLVKKSICEAFDL